MVCRRYDPDLKKFINQKKVSGYKIVTIGQLIDNKQLEDFGTKDRVLKDDYLIDEDVESMPFIRTSDIGNLEIVKTTAKKIPRSLCYYKEGDILFVKDGDELVGETALVLKSDLPFALQSHFRCFRVSG